MPVDYELRDGVAYATIRTSNSRVNILNRETTRELEQIVSGIDARSTEALVIRSGCRGSFVNGVGLMLAHAVQTTAGIVEASRPARRAYAAVRACAVPTIAAIQGTCWGCGVELVLHCDYRLADDWFETHFYMTELNDYLFVPLFASTWNLCHQVGLSAAIEMLLWGKRLRAVEARNVGILDEVVAADRFDAQVHDFSKAAAAQPRRDSGARAAPWRQGDDTVVERARQHITQLPESERPVYERTLDLLVRAARHDLDRTEHRLLEVAASADSALSAVGKRAFAFFYVRHMNQAATEAGPDPVEPIEVAARVTEADRTFAAWYDSLAAMRLRVARLTKLEPNASVSGTELVLRSAHAKGASGIPVWTELGAVPGSDPIELYAPRTVGRATVEIKADADARADVRRLVDVFRHADYEVVVSRRSARFAIPELVRAWTLPVQRFLAECDADAQARCAIVKASLVALGFGGSAEKSIATHTAITPEPPAEPDRALMEAITLSLLDGVRGCCEQGGLPQPRAIDVVAREVLGFPLSMQSLCWWLSPSRVAEALTHAEPRWVDQAVIQHAKEFVAHGEPFYR